MTHQTVLLAGATGMLGKQITRALLERPEPRVRLMVRPSDSADKQAVVAGLRARGAEVVHADLTDPASLDRATRGVDVIISAVQGGPDVIIDGQLALAEAGARNGVGRILPSDYGLDVFKATPGEHLMFDLRRKADAAIAAIGIEHVRVLQGAVMDLFRPGAGTIDLKGGTVSFWGDDTCPIEVTTVADTAAMIARVALDDTVASGEWRVRLPGRPRLDPRRGRRRRGADRAPARAPLVRRCGYASRRRAAQGLRAGVRLQACRDCLAIDALRQQ